MTFVVYVKIRCTVRIIPVFLIFIGATAEQGNGLALDRPGLEMVTQAVLAGKVDMVLVNSIDRIGREWGMTQAYIDLLTQHKVKLLCIRDRLLFDKQGVTYF